MNVGDLVGHMTGLLVHGLAVQLSTDPSGGLAAGFPEVVVQPLRGRRFSSETCSTDGYYEESHVAAGGAAVIFVDTDVAARRQNFTLIHELGHHLIRGVDPDLLDTLDNMAGDRGNPEDVEERVCHRFAADILIPRALRMGTGRPTPDDVVELHARTKASWEACAIAVAEQASGTAAVLVIRQPDRVGLAACTTALGRWPSGSLLDPSGPLRRASTQDQHSKRATYAWRTRHERALWVDTVRPTSNTTIAVLVDSPSDGRVNILPEQTTGTAEAQECARCPDGLRSVDWCDTCHGRRCETCNTCGCWTPAAQQTCEGCFLQKPAFQFPTAEPTCEDCLDR